MLVAPPARSIVIRSVFAATLTLWCGAIACRDGSQAGAAERDAAGTATNGPREPGEVVISAPKGRYTVSAVAAPGSISGSVDLARSVTPGAAHETGRDSGVCGATIPDESIVRQGSGVVGAVVWLEDIRSGKALPLERRYELESAGCRLKPRVQAGLVNSAVNVIGHDAFRQHLRFAAAGDRAPRASVLLDNYEQVVPTERPFQAPGLVAVRDADHPWPAAYIAVFDHPYFAVTGANGSFTIDGVPPGKYRLSAWHERARKTEQQVVVQAGGAATVALTLEGR